MEKANHKHNIFANYLGQGWAATIGLACLPLYINILGIEAYGLIGLFAMMQSWLTLLDMGLTPTLTREMARYHAGAHLPSYIHDLLRTIEISSATLLITIGAFAWQSIGYISTSWLKSDAISTELLSKTLAVMIFVALLRFFEGIYRGALYGLQKQVWFNVANACLATLRHAGAIIVIIHIERSIQAFFYWQAFVSVLAILLYSVKVYNVLPDNPIASKFNKEVITNIWRFAAGMLSISALSIILTQIDKVILSRMISLESFGYYSLAGTAAGIFYLAVIPITQALYPRMVIFFTQNNSKDMAKTYHIGSQLVTSITTPIALISIIFSEELIYTWSGSKLLAKEINPTLIPLMLGTFLNGLMHMPYQLQLANGLTDFTVKANLIGIVILIPAILLVVPEYGTSGSAWIWVLLNAGYVFIAIHYLHRRLLKDEKRKWYLDDLLLPFCGSLCVILILKNLSPSTDHRLHWLAYFIALASLMTLGSLFSSNTLRPALHRIINKYFHTNRT